MRNNVPVPAPTYALPFPFIVHLPLPPTTLSPSTKYSGESHKGWLLQLVDIMAWDGGMHQHGQRLTDADRHSLSLRGAERAAALHPSSPLQPRSIATEILSSPSSSFEPVPTYPPFPLPLHIECSKPVLATTTTATTGPSPIPRHPRRPRRNYKHSFHTKSRCWRCPETSPARAAFSLRIAIRSSTIPPFPPPLLNPFPNSRDYRGGRGGGRVDSSSDAFQTRFLAEFFPEKRKNIDDFAASPR